MKLLAMKRLSLAILAVTVVAVLPAHADEWSKTYNLSGKPDLRIETSDANIRVTTWDQHTIEAKVITTHYKIGEDGIRVEERQNGDSVEIDVRYPHHNFNIEWGQHRVDIIIQMPREGRVTLRTGDGKIDVAGLKGEMNLHSGDGSENLEAVDGKLHATTGDGHITAQGRFDELELKTGDGHVEVRAAGGSSLAAGWRLETGDGNVSLEVPGELAADVDLHTSDGHIDLDVPITTEGKIRQNEVRGKLNGGGSSLTIRTGDGSIHLRKG
jgi:putative adhesin